MRVPGREIALTTPLFSVSQSQLHAARGVPCFAASFGTSFMAFCGAFSLTHIVLRSMKRHSVVAYALNGLYVEELIQLLSSQTFLDVLRQSIY